MFKTSYFQTSRKKNRVYGKKNGYGGKYDILKYAMYNKYNSIQIHITLFK